jgi:hypothetical protein
VSKNRYVQPEIKSNPPNQDLSKILHIQTENCRGSKDGMMQSYAKSIHTEQRRFQELEVQQVTGPEVKLYPEVCEIKGCVDAGLLNGDYGGVP